MAMNGDQLGMEIANAVTDPLASPDAKLAVIAFYQKIANAIVGHIQNNAVVPAGIGVTTTGGDGKTNEPGTIK